MAKKKNKLRDQELQNQNLDAEMAQEFAVYGKQEQEQDRQNRQKRNKQK